MKIKTPNKKRAPKHLAMSGIVKLSPRARFSVNQKSSAKALSQPTSSIAEPRKHSCSKRRPQRAPCATPAQAPHSPLALGRRKSFHVDSPRATAGLGAAAGACPSWLWPLPQPWPLLECRAGPCPAPPRWPRVRSPPGRSCARSARPPLCINNMRAARAKSWEQLSSPPAWWAQEELQVWDLAWLLHFVLIYFHARFSLRSSRGTEIASKRIYSLKNERERKLKMHFSVTKHTTKALPGGCPWPALPWGHGEHEGPRARRRPSRWQRGRPPQPPPRRACQPAPSSPSTDVGRAASAVPCAARVCSSGWLRAAAGAFLLFFFFGASSHGGVAAASSHVASLLSPCHSCNAAFPALQGLSAARTMSGCVCCLLACSLARGLHHIAVTALAIRMGPPGHCAQEFPLPAPLHGLTPNYLGS